MDRFIVVTCVGIAVLAVSMGLSAMYCLSQVDWAMVMR